MLESFLFPINLPPHIQHDNRHYYENQTSEADLRESLLVEEVAGDGCCHHAACAPCSVANAQVNLKQGEAEANEANGVEKDAGN